MITLACQTSLSELIEALATADLPTCDIDTPDCSFFRFEDAGGLVGFVGLEGIGYDRLLRSLVVLPRRRGNGFGRAVSGLIETHARRNGVARLHLLTVGASSFFTSIGFATADRHRAPSSIATSRQFKSLCPASATYMFKAL